MSKEIDILSGLDETDNSGEPSIIIENSQQRSVIPLYNNDLGLTNKIDVVKQEYTSSGSATAGRDSSFGRKFEENIKSVPNKTVKPVVERKISNVSTVSSNSSYPEYKRSDYKNDTSDNLSIPDIPLDFGDIADPVKHKTTPKKDITEETYSMGSMGSDTESLYSHQEKTPKYNEPSSSNTRTYNDPPNTRTYNNQSSYNNTQSNNDYYTENEEKQNLLIKLQGLESRGARLTREFSMKSSIEDIRFEYEKQSSMMERDNSVEFMKNCLITLVSGVEFANNKFDPIGAKLGGWSESVMENIGSYETIFAKLHEKYRGSVDIAPELELLMTLATSAFMYHMMQTVFKQAIPNLGPAMMQDPNLMSGLGQAAARAADMSRQQQQGIPTPSNQPMGGPSQGLDIGSLLGSMMGGMQPNQGGGGFAQSFQNPLPRPVDPRSQQPPMTGYNQQKPGYSMADNYANRPARDDDENSRVTDASTDSEGSGIRIRKSKSDKKIIDLGDF